MGRSIPKITALRMIKHGRTDDDIEAATGFSIIEIIAIRAEFAGRARPLKRLVKRDADRDEHAG